MTPLERDAEIRRLADAGGHTQRAIGRLVGCSHSHVRTVLARPRPAATATHREPERPEPPANEDELTRLRRHCAEIEQEIARAAGDVRTVAMHRRTLAMLAPVVARLAREASAETDLLRVSRADVAGAIASVRDRVRVLTSRALMCAACSRELSVTWSSGGVAGGDSSDGA